MNLRLSFTWVGPVIFALPMLINVAYALFPPAEKSASTGRVTRWVEVVEQSSRIVYLLLLTFAVSTDPLRRKSVWLALAAVFLVLYYIVWLRYFIGGRNVALLGRPFLLVPVPLAVFPVLYFLCAAVWMGNLPAAVAMGIFGAAHLTVSVQSLGRACAVPSGQRRRRREK